MLPGENLKGVFSLGALRALRLLECEHIIL